MAKTFFSVEHYGLTISLPREATKGINPTLYRASALVHTAELLGAKLENMHNENKFLKITLTFYDLKHLTAFLEEAPNI